MRLSGKSWNQGNVDDNAFPMQRRRATRRVHIDAPVEGVFERACLTGQPGWLPAGSVHLSHSDSGLDEPNALWSEGETGPSVFRQPELQTFWTTTRIDPERRCCQAVAVNPEIAVGTLDVEMEERDDGTLVRFGLSYTVLSEAGSALFDQGFEGRMGQLLERFGDTLTRAVAAESAVPVTRAPHRTRRHGVAVEITIDGDIDECFALACPVAELEWIDGWTFDLIYSESGTNETGCVFLEPSSGLSMLCSPGANNYWYVTRYDAKQHRFEAVWSTSDLAIARWQVQMTDLGGGQTRVHWSLMYTGLGEKGSRLIAEPGLESRMTRGLSFLANALKHYVETGEMYRLSTHRKLRIVASLIGASLGRHLRGQSMGGRRASNVSR
jgi:hypothetical protein